MQLGLELVQTKEGELFELGASAVIDLLPVPKEIIGIRFREGFLGIAYIPKRGKI